MKTNCYFDLKTKYFTTEQNTKIISEPSFGYSKK